MEGLWLNCTLLTKVLVHVGGCDVDCEMILNTQIGVWKGRQDGVSKMEVGGGLCQVSDEGWNMDVASTPKSTVGIKK